MNNCSYELSHYPYFCAFSVYLYFFLNFSLQTTSLVEHKVPIKNFTSKILLSFIFHSWTLQFFILTEDVRHTWNFSFKTQKELSFNISIYKKRSSFPFHLTLTLPFSLPENWFKYLIFSTLNYIYNYRFKKYLYYYIKISFRELQKWNIQMYS